MTVLTNQGDVKPSLRLRARDDADCLALGLEYWALFDMRLEESAEGAAAARQVSRIPDAGQLRADGLAIRVLDGQGVIKIELAAEDPAGQHRRREPTAFLVGPDGDFDRRLGFNTMIVETSDDLEAGKDTVNTVELTAMRLRVEMAAGHNWWQAVIASGPSCENITHAVDRHVATSVARPGHEEISPFLVFVGQRQTTAPAVRQSADLGHIHEAVPQTIRVDP